jgi:hypothetical protein
LTEGDIIRIRRFYQADDFYRRILSRLFVCHLRKSGLP